MHSFVKEDQEKLGQSQEVAMEDSNTMTMDILRAQLLSERSISRSARQQAEELAKRVVELEEQLKFVSLQRTKAEKATAKVLAILENNGINDFSEVYDSNSEQEGGGNGAGEVDDVRTDEVRYTTSTPTRTEEVEGSSALELGVGVSPLISRCSSWKSCSDIPDTPENVIGLDESRSCGSFVSAGGVSTRHSLGKSRGFKQKENRSSEAVGNDGSLFGAHEHAAATNHGDVSHSNAVDTKVMKEYRKIGGKVYCRHLVQVSREDQRREASNEAVRDGSQGNANMDRAIKHQARHMGQFEAQENAQKEWEGKSKGNNSPDSRNQSDTTSERDDIRRETTNTHQTNSTTTTTSSSSPDFSFPDANKSNQTPALGTVLDALQQAKLSLNKLASKPADLHPNDIPLGYPPPTPPESQLNLARYYNMDMMDTGIGLPSPSRFMYPSYIDLMPRMSSNQLFLSKYTSGEDRYLEYSDRLREDMYKR